MFVVNSVSKTEWVSNKNSLCESMHSNGNLCSAPMLNASTNGSWLCEIWRSCDEEQLRATEGLAGKLQVKNMKNCKTSSSNQTQIL